MLRVVDSPQFDQTRWFAAEMQPHGPALRGWPVHRFGSRLAVDDVVHVAFLRVWRVHAAGEYHSP